MAIELYLAYVLACVVLVVVPGPNVTLIVANSLKHGARAGLLNVLGSQLGLAVVIAVLIVGLASIIDALGQWFDWLRLIGAAYLVWIGWKLLRTAGGEESAAVAVPRGGFVLQGFLVMLSNPKTLLFFGAFIPQFVDPNANYVTQVAVLGVTAMAIAALSDSAYTLLTGRAGVLLSRGRVRLVSRTSGACLVGGGFWLGLRGQ